MPPLSNPMQGTPTSLQACTSHTVSPTNTASSGRTLAFSRATCTRSGAGLLRSTSPDEVTSSTASSAFKAARSAANSRLSAELAKTTRRPWSLQARSSSGAPASGRWRDQYVAYSAPCAARMPSSASRSRSGGNSASSNWSEPIPIARWMRAIGTS